MRAALVALCVLPSLASALPSLASEPPARYNEPAPARARTPLERRIAELVARLAREQRRSVPVPDARLDAATVDIARAMPAHAEPPNELVQGAMWLHGIVEPPPHLLITAFDAGAPESSLVDGLAADLPNVLSQGRYSRVGVALVPDGSGETRVLVALQESFLRLEPVPRALPWGGPAALRGELASGFERPEAFVTAPDGKVTRLPLDGDARRFAGRFQCGPQKGRYQLEVAGEDRFGAAVLANFPVWCGQAAPSTLAQAEPAPSAREEPWSSPEQAEQAVWRLVNADRARARLPALQWDAGLAAVARAHSEDMRAHGFFGHVSPSTGSAGDRVKRAGIGALVVMENVARASSPGEAERGLMNSPGHRANILGDATHVGVGVVVASDGPPRELLVTQLFTRPTQPIDAGTGRRLRREIAELRAGRKLRPLADDAQLDDVATRVADGMAHAGLSSRDAQRQVEAELTRARVWESLRCAVGVFGDASQVANELRATIGDAGSTHIGLGLAPGRKDDATVVYVVLVLATQR